MRLTTVLDSISVVLVILGLSVGAYAIYDRLNQSPPYDNPRADYEINGTVAHCFSMGLKLDPESEAAYMLARDGLMPIDEFRATIRMNYPRLRASVIDCLVDEIYPQT